MLTKGATAALFNNSSIIQILKANATRSNFLTGECVKEIFRTFLIKRNIQVFRICMKERCTFIMRIPVHVPPQLRRCFVVSVSSGLRTGGRGSRSCLRSSSSLHQNCVKHFDHVWMKRLETRINTVLKVDTLVCILLLGDGVRQTNSCETL